MENEKRIGVDTIRKESWDKVTGRAKYNYDTISPDFLYAKMVTSTYAHAIIKSIDIKEALKAKGVQSIITGEYFPVLSGSVIQDRPPIASGKVRYFGEPVAVVVANSEQEAMQAVNLVKVEYEPLPVVNSVSASIKSDATIIHEGLALYYCPLLEASPQHNSNIAGHIKIRKGNIEEGWKESDVIIESSFSLPQSDHLAMEPRNVRAQILPDGNVIIHTSSQGPFAVKEELSKLYGIPEGNVIVHTPLVGGGFGGKAAVQLEFIAYLASKSVDGRIVSLSNSREVDIASSPSKLGMEGKVKIGATKDGLIKAFESTYFVDCGAYSDTGPRMAKAAAGSCTGPYNIANVNCDSFALYTNHCYVTSYRGFGHTGSTFAMERILDQLALKLNMDPLELRLKNAVTEGKSSPTQNRLTLSNMGNLSACILKLKERINWSEGQRIVTDKGTIISKGLSCFWKTSNSGPNATSGVILMLNSDGSVNLNFGAVEIGPGMKTTIAQIVAERMKMDLDKIHVFMNVNTQITPKHWKTVASMTTFMVGNAAIKAADSLIEQLHSIASIALRCSKEEVAVQDQKVFLKDSPGTYIHFKDLAHGYSYPDGPAIGGQIMGHGNYMMKHLRPLNPDSGQGKTGESWTVGAQAVEIEYNPQNYSYRLLRAATVIDAGKVINPKAAAGVIMGGMNMGLGLATREEFLYNENGILENTSLRTYKVTRFGENPEYIVDFIETPQIDAPFGARGLGEHGILGMPSAFANAISLAAETDFNTIPISPELIWRTKTGGKYDSI